MKHQKPFRFKQFEVRHDRCAMKVNTDGVLLGAWADVRGVGNALDVGTGSGIIALMLAQRGVKYIEAIELDAEAAAQAAENFAASPWASCLNAHHLALQEYTPSHSFDLIVSNPPYFDNAYKTPLANRNMARHNDSLPLADLMHFSTRYLSNNGRLALILPIDLEANAIDAAELMGLHPQQCCYVKGTAGGETKRAMMSFGRDEIEMLTEQLTIETSPLQYSDEYRQLTKDFYLAF